MPSENQAKTLKVASVAMCIALCIVAAFIFAGRSDVFNLGNGTDGVRNELTDAEKSQSRAAESLDRAGELVESAAERNREIADGNQSLQDSERRDEEILRESEQILERVRARAKE